jgi:hypothetical protein
MGIFERFLGLNGFALTELLGSIGTRYQALQAGLSHDGLTARDSGHGFGFRIEKISKARLGTIRHDSLGFPGGINRRQQGTTGCWVGFLHISKVGLGAIYPEPLRGWAFDPRRICRVEVEYWGGG